MPCFEQNTNWQKTKGKYMLKFYTKPHCNLFEQTELAGVKGNRIIETFH